MVKTFVVIIDIEAEGVFSLTYPRAFGPYPSLEAAEQAAESVPKIIGEERIKTQAMAIESTDVLPS